MNTNAPVTLTLRRPTKGGPGLRGKLVRSHLTVAAIGVAVLAFALVQTLNLRSWTKHVATVQAPLVDGVRHIQHGINVSLTSLHNWIEFKDPAYATARRVAWDEEIRPALNRMQALQATSVDNEYAQQLARLTRLATDLEYVQWWVEDLAGAPGNEPANAMFVRRVVPLGESILDSCDVLFDAVRQGADPDLISSAAEIRGHLSRALYTLSSHSALDWPTLSQQLARHQLVVEENLSTLDQRKEELGAAVRTELSKLRDRVRQFERTAAEIIEMKKGLHSNLSKALVESEMRPIASELTHALDAIANRQAAELNEVSSNANLLASAEVGTLSFFIVVLIMVTFPFASRTSHEIGDPIANLVRAMRRFAAGGDPGKIPFCGDAEIDELITSFDAMWASVKRSNSEMTTYIGELEDARVRLEGYAHRLAERTLQLEQSRGLASEAIEARTGIIAGTMSELQTPLRAIIYATTQLLSRFSDSQQSTDAKDLLSIARNAQSLLNRMTDVFDIAGIETGVLPASSQHLDLSDLLQEVEVWCEELARDRQLKLEIRISATYPAVDGDRKLLKRAFCSLIASQIDRSEQISIGVDVGVDSAIGRVVIIGIDYSSPDLVNNDSNSTVHQCSLDRSEGINFMLADRIVALHGGRIDFRKAPDNGGSYEVHLPRFELSSSTAAGNNSDPCLDEAHDEPMNCSPA